MTFGDILIIALVVIVIIGALLYFFNKKTYKKVIEAQDFIEQNKIKTSIFVINKKFEKPTEKNMPKAIYEKLPKMSKLRKMPIIKAKVGPQIVTLMSDKNVYDVLQVKKTVKVELAGIYIVKIIGMNLEDKKKKTWKDKLTLAANPKNK